MQGRTWRCILHPSQESVQLWNRLTINESKAKDRTLKEILHIYLGSSQISMDAQFTFKLIEVHLKKMILNSKLGMSRSGGWGPAKHLHPTHPPLSRPRPDSTQAMSTMAWNVLSGWAEGALCGSNAAHSLGGLEKASDIYPPPPLWECVARRW